MKKVLLRKLQSLTAILVLNTATVSLVQASGIGYEAEPLQARVLADDRRNSLKSSQAQPDTLNQLYFENSLAYVQKHSDKSLSYQHQVALAMVEEAYQDDYDALLDQYEREIEDAAASLDYERIEMTKNRVEDQLQDLKAMRRAKIAEFDRQFSVV